MESPAAPYGLRYGEDKRVPKLEFGNQGEEASAPVFGSWYCAEESAVGLG